MAVCRDHKKRCCRFGLILLILEMFYWSLCRFICNPEIVRGRLLNVCFERVMHLMRLILFAAPPLCHTGLLLQSILSFCQILSLSGRLPILLGQVIPLLTLLPAGYVFVKLRGRIPISSISDPAFREMESLPLFLFNEYSVIIPPKKKTWNDMEHVECHH